jgi:hypothetical protein
VCGGAAAGRERGDLGFEDPPELEQVLGGLRVADEQPWNGWPRVSPSGSRMTLPSPWRTST